MTTRVSGTDLLPFHIDISYQGDEATARVKQILNLPDITSWKIIDRWESLVMIHYEEDAPMDTVGHLRGTVIDLETEAIVADSFGYTPIVVTDSLSEGSELCLTDQGGQLHTFPLEGTVIKKAFEGVVIRVIWYQGQCHKLTHRRINTARSRWSSKKTFLAMYDEAGGPTPEQLFDTTKPYSSTCYSFLVVDPSLLVATRQKVSSPYLVFLSAKEMDLKRNPDEVASGKTDFITTDTVGADVTGPLIHQPQQLSIAEANAHLKHGFHPPTTTGDPRQLPGESLIIYRQQEGKVVDIVKVHSPAYEWRNSMRGDNSNLYNQFFLLLNLAYPALESEQEWNMLRQKLLILPRLTHDMMLHLYRKHGGLLQLPLSDEPRSAFFKRDTRIHLLWVNFVLSLPFSHQEEGITFLKKYQDDLKQLTDWVIAVAEQKVIMDPNHRTVKVVQSLIEKAQWEAARSFPPRTLGWTKTVRHNIASLIKKKDGKKLYMMIKDLRDSNRK